MNNNNFLRRYYRYLNRDVPIPDFSKINIYKYDFSKHFENVPSEINISTINPQRLVDKLSREKENIDGKWGDIGDHSVFNIREYVQMDKLTSDDYDWDAFDQMAYRYQYLSRKKFNNRLSYTDRQEMDNLFTKMLSCMIHFYTKKEMYHLESSSPTVEIDDYDSTIAMTLIRCLSLHDLSQKEVIERISISEDEAGTILFNEFGLQPDFWFSSKEMLFSIIEKKKDYFKWTPAPYILNGQIYYPQEIYCDFYEEVQKLGQRNKIDVPEPRVFGFNRRKAQKFAYYLCGSIDKELYKLYRRQFTVHVPAKHSVPNTVINTIAIMNKDEYTGMGYSEAMFNEMDAQITNAMGSYTNPAEVYEEKTTLDDFYNKVLKLHNGEMLLFKVGIDVSGDNFFETNKKRTFKVTGEKYGLSEYETKKEIKKIVKEFKKAYPNFFNEYVVA